MVKVLGRYYASNLRNKSEKILNLQKCVKSGVSGGKMIVSQNNIVKGKNYVTLAI